MQGHDIIWQSVWIVEHYLTSLSPVINHDKTKQKDDTKKLDHRVEQQAINNKKNKKTEASFLLIETTANLTLFINTRLSSDVCIMSWSLREKLPVSVWSSFTVIHLQRCDTTGEISVENDNMMTPVEPASDRLPLVQKGPSYAVAEQSHE